VVRSCLLCVTSKPDLIGVSEEYPTTEEVQLRSALESDPTDWSARRQLANALYDRSAYRDAADVIWSADEIPNTDLDLAFSARILSKSQPRKAIRLLTAVLELNRGKSVQNMGMANALLHHGMVLQAARFYGAALEADPSLVNPDFEHFVLWSDEEMTMWGDFKERRPTLGELPWMARDPLEAQSLVERVSTHTTPIALPKLPAVPGEDLSNPMYQQAEAKGAKITPPPAVTIPIDRVDPKHRLFDSTYGAAVTVSAPANTPSAPANAPAAPANAPAAAVESPVAPPAQAAATPPATGVVRPPSSALPGPPTPIALVHPPTRPMVHGAGADSPAPSALVIPQATAGMSPQPTRRLITPALMPGRKPILATPGGPPPAAAPAPSPEEDKAKP
jgi:hypothetical protein